ncbi:helix-turn-helix transcriptional regulator [Actinacidiphila oryziradicis]|uniref:Transcription regulator PadR N-terminal domain-containing protein n=1 Tax=Actinacidiphila oryziradicis TaxID=2571141 RepID=A0A4U0SN32_9ACTN|nr:hypothetical protein FCI23_12770 [Actinacidiphila oryziradicis]
MYPALHRLETAGLVSSVWGETTWRRRRVYEIARAGEHSLSDTRANWRDIIATMRSVVLNEEPLY